MSPRPETRSGNKFKIKQLFIGLRIIWYLLPASQPPDEFQAKPALISAPLSSHDFHWSPIYFLLPLIRPEINKFRTRSSSVVFLRERAILQLLRYLIDIQYGENFRAAGLGQTLIITLHWCQWMIAVTRHSTRCIPPYIPQRLVLCHSVIHSFSQPTNNREARRTSE